MKDINKKVIINVLASFLSQGISFLMAPVFAQMLAPSEYGVSTVYLSWVAIVSIIISLQVYGSINNAYVDYGENTLPTYISTIWWVALASFLVVFLITIVFSPWLSSFLGLPLNLLLLMLIHAFGSSCINILVYYLRVLKKIAQSSALSFALVISNVLCSLLLLYFMQENRYMGRILGAAIPNIVIGIGASLYILKIGKHAFISEKVRYALKIALPLVFHGIGGYILAQSDRQMLYRMIGEAEAGIYSYSYTISSISNMIWAAINTIWVVYFYDDLKENNLPDLMARSHKYLRLFSAITIVFLLVTKDTIYISAPKSYWAGAEAAPYIILSNYMIFLYSFASNFEFFHKKTGNIAVGTAAAAVLNIILNLLLIPNYKSVGAAVATLISYTALFIFHDASAKRIGTSFCYGYRFYLKGLFPVLAATVLVTFVPAATIFKWAIAIIIMIVEVISIVKQKGLF